MARRFLAVAFVLAAFAPEAFVSAQQSTQSATTHTHASTGSNTKAPAGAHHSAPPNSRHGHYRSPYANGVYVNGTPYLAPSTPKPPPGKNKVKKPAPEVFKSISN